MLQFGTEEPRDVMFPEKLVDDCIAILPVAGEIPGRRNGYRGACEQEEFGPTAAGDPQQRSHQRKRDKAFRQNGEPEENASDQQSSPSA